MTRTPSARRREGRNAFYPGGDPNKENPYLHSKKWGADIFAKDWRDGWDEAEAAYLAEEQSRKIDHEVATPQELALVELREALSFLDYTRVIPTEEHVGEHKPFERLERAARKAAEFAPKFRD